MVKYKKNVDVCAPLYAGLVKNAARPEGQGLNLCLFLVKTNFLEGKVVVVGRWGWSGLAWHFLCSEILFIRPEDPAKSHQPAANKHTGLYCEGPRTAYI